ncbi:MAG: hypothetical protein EA402_08190 [Planctomycetota bacterium]|nr:MAG: hypothetical protein EA402_08190 [Planctomycetota bacterium]
MSYANDNSQALPAIRPLGERQGLSTREWQFVASLPLAGAVGMLAIGLGSWLGEEAQSPAQLSRLLSEAPTPASALVAELPATLAAPAPRPSPNPAAALVVESEGDESSRHRPQLQPNPAAPLRWAPTRMAAERAPSDHPPVPAGQPIELRVVTIRARVTAYTPYDHAQTHPQWADGIVAWHPGGRQRRVANHRYGLATDWAQFPPGATFIRVPGYMEQSFPNFPESFRVVDDACGASRRARRLGLQPVIDVRFMTRFSAIDPRGGWGSRELNVEVIYPADFRIPADLRRWVVSDEWHVYYDGQLQSKRPR